MPKALKIKWKNISKRSSASLYEEKSINDIGETFIGKRGPG